MKPKPPPPHIVAARTLAARHRFLAVHGGLYIYANGVYGDAEQIVRREAQLILSKDSRKATHDEAIYWLINKFGADPALVDRGPVINVQNGLLDPQTRVLRPHTPNVLTTVQLPVEWNPTAYHERADRFLNQVLPSPETRQLLEESVGYCLLPDCRFEKAVMLTGSGANGKSTFIKWLIGMLGRDNVSAVSLQDLAKERFRLAPVVGRVANTFADLPREALKETAIFKALVSGDVLTAEEKYRPPFKFQNRAKLFFSANELPRSDDVTEAFFRRWVIVPFPRAFLEGDPRRDQGLSGVLESPEARAYLLRLGVEGLARLLTNGRFTQTPESEAAMNEYRLDADSVRSFIEEHAVVGRDKEVRKADLYARYKDVTESAGLRPADYPLFGKRLRSLLPNLDEVQRRETHRRVRYYVGIALDSTWGVRHEA